LNILKDVNGMELEKTLLQIVLQLAPDNAAPAR
jgi:hypothetical protein